MAATLNSILETNIKIKVVDVGANPVDGPAPYQPLLESGAATVVGFEPAPQALAKLLKAKGPNETYLPFAVGDGEVHTLNICAQSGMTSLLKPDPKIMALLHQFSDWSRIIATEEMKTVRLDDVPEAAAFDLLKIDIQGAEFMVMQNALAGLSRAVFVQTEVEFMPLYIGQPLFSDVDLFMRAQGFVLHRFDELKSRVLKPLVANNDLFAGLSQIFWADALYIRDFTRLEAMSSEQLLKLALILHDMCGSYDVVLYLLIEHDRRAGTQHAQSYQTRGLGAPSKA